MEEITYNDLLPESAGPVLSAYKYKGKDDSILYEYFISPVCQYATDYHVPRWMAPNLITVVGFMFNVIPHLMIIWSEDPGSTPSNALFFVQGLSMIIYSLCDNTDGKQARKTNTSSPLGMILDHGCDAISCCLLTLSVSSLLGLSKRMQALMLAVNAFLFFMANLEQYFTHYLYLPKINAVSEGLWGIAVMCMVSPLLGGQAFWLSTPLGFPNNWFVVFIPLFTMVLNMIGHTKNILEKVDARKYIEGMQFPLAWVLILIQSYWLGGIQDYSLMYVYSFNISKGTIICQISHCTGKVFNPYRILNIVQIALMAISAISASAGKSIDGINGILCTVAIIDFGYFAWVVCTRIAALCNIKVFSIPY